MLLVVAFLLLSLLVLLVLQLLLVMMLLLLGLLFLLVAVVTVVFCFQFLSISWQVGVSSLSWSILEEFKLFFLG